VEDLALMERAVARSTSSSGTSSSVASPNEGSWSVEDYFRSSIRVEGFSSETWVLQDNIFIRGSSGTVLLLASWSLLAAIVCSYVAVSNLPDDIRLPDFIQSLKFNSIIYYLSYILCSFWSGAVAREFTAAILTWHKVMRLTKRQKQGETRVFEINAQDKRRNLDVEVPDMEEKATFYEAPVNKPRFALLLFVPLVVLGIVYACRSAFDKEFEAWKEEVTYCLGHDGYGPGCFRLKRNAASGTVCAPCFTLAPTSAPTVDPLTAICAQCVAGGVGNCYQSGVYNPPAPLQAECNGNAVAATVCDPCFISAPTLAPTYYAHTYAPTYYASTYKPTYAPTVDPLTDVCAQCVAWARHHSEQIISSLSMYCPADAKEWIYQLDLMNTTISELIRRRISGSRMGALECQQHQIFHPEFYPGGKPSFVAVFPKEVSPAQRDDCKFVAELDIADVIYEEPYANYADADLYFCAEQQIYWVYGNFMSESKLQKLEDDCNEIRRNGIGYLEDTYVSKHGHNVSFFHGSFEHCVFHHGNELDYYGNELDCSKYYSCENLVIAVGGMYPDPVALELAIKK
jgi:hypothetical protein